MVTQAALPYIARGDVLPLRSALKPPPAPLADLDEEKWSHLIRALVLQDLGAATSDGFGRFAMRPRRLGDLGLMANLRRVPDVDGRMIWEGDFVPPLTRDGFLGSLQAQAGILVRSITLHAADIEGESLPVGVTRSGAFAILHRGGPGALRAWTEGPRFERTVEAFNRANGIF